MKRRHLGLPLAVDHFADELGQALGHAVEPFVPLLRRGQGRARVGLIRDSLIPDIIRELSQGKRGLELLRVPGQVVRQTLATLQ